MRYEYRTFVINPPQLLEEQPQLTNHVVRTALDNTFSRGRTPAEVVSVGATRLDDGRLRVATSLFRGPGVAGTQSSYAAAFRHNIHEAARAVERDGISYLFTGVLVPRCFVDNPELREMAVRGAVERAFPELVGQQYRLDHDLHCEVHPHRGTNPGAASHYVLDVALTAGARSGLEAQDVAVRYVSFDRHLGDRTRELEARREMGDIAEGGGGGGLLDGGDGDETARLLIPITASLSPELERAMRDFGRDDSLIASALERTFPELRDGAYGFDYELGEDSVLQITLSAQPQQSLQPQAAGVWEISLAAAGTERAAALESNLDDVIREARDDVHRASFLRAFSR